MSGAVQKAQGLLVTWFLGTQTGTAVADVVFGDYNPSGAVKQQWGGAPRNRQVGKHNANN